MTDTLILDYSWSGTTPKLAQQLQTALQADRLAVTVAPDTFPADMTATDKVAKQQLAAGKLPALTTSLPDLSGYHRLLIGGPVWSGTVSTPVRELFATLPAFSGQLVPFYTDAGVAGQYEADFAKLAGDHATLPGLEMTAGELQDTATVQTKILTWWQSLTTPEN